MSKGSKIVPIRIPEDLLEQILVRIASANVQRSEEPYTMSSWIIKCIRDRLDHNTRSRRKRRRKPPEGIKEKGIVPDSEYSGTIFEKH